MGKYLSGMKLSYHVGMMVAYLECHFHFENKQTTYLKKDNLFDWNEFKFAELPTVSRISVQARPVVFSCRFQG